MVSHNLKITMKTVKYNCEFCGKEVHKYISHTKPYKHHFCGYKCKSNWQIENLKGNRNPCWRGGKIERICIQCGEKFKLFKSALVKHKKRSSIFCSRECKCIYNRKQISLRDSKELWYVFGALKGDGNIYKNRISFSVKDKEFAEEFHQCCKSIGLNPSNIKIKSSKTTKQGFLYVTYSTSINLTEWCNKLEYNQILLLSRGYKVAFLRGFFDAEGCFSKSKNQNGYYSYSASITNTNKCLIDIVKGIVSSLGFNSSIHIQNNNHYKTSYNIRILDGRKKTEEFLDLIQPSIPRKQWSL